MRTEILFIILEGVVSLFWAIGMVYMIYRFCNRKKNKKTIRKIHLDLREKKNNDIEHNVIR